MQKTTSKTASKKNIKCPYCGSKTANFDEKLVCTNCSSVIDPNSIKNRKSSSKPTMTHLKPSDLQIKNEISVHSMDFDEESSKHWQKLLHVSDASERNMAATLFEITKIGQNLRVSDSVLKFSLEFYRKIIYANLTKRTPIRVLAATIVYAACRENGIAISLNQVGYLAKINSAKMRHVYNILLKKMKKNSQPNVPDLYVSKLAINLFKQKQAIEAAEKIILALQYQRFAQAKNPVGLAASACYIASILSGERKTQREIAEVARITEATMRTRYKQIAEHLHLQISL